MPLEHSSFEQLPEPSLRAWRDYADAVLVATVASAEELPPDPAEKADQRSVSRAITFRVDTTVWSRIPGPTELQVTQPGWHQSGGRRQELDPERATRVEAGRQYLLAAIRLYDGTWSLFGASSVFAVQGAVVRVAEAQRADPVPAAEELEGQTVDAVRRSLERLPADPIVEHYAAYPAVPRYALVYGRRTDQRNLDAVSERMETTTVPPPPGPPSS